MGLGKAQKQKRNLYAKLAKMAEKAKSDYDTIAKLDNNRSYAIEKDGEMLLGGIFASGLFWKQYYNITINQ